MDMYWVGGYGGFWANLYTMLLSGGSGSTWTNNADGTNSYNLANDPGAIQYSAVSSSNTNPQKPIATFPVWDASGGEQIGQIDLIGFSPKNAKSPYGITLSFAYTGLYSAADIGLNWQQYVITSSQNANSPVDTWYEDGYDKDYYYSPKPTDPHYVGRYYSTGVVGQRFNSADPNGTQYDLLYGDDPGRGNTGFYWKANLSLVIMGPNGPSATLATISYGFTFNNEGEISYYYY